MHQAIPRDTRWIKDSVAAFDPPANKVITATGKETQARLGTFSGRLHRGVWRDFWTLEWSPFVTMTVSLHRHVILVRREERVDSDLPALIRIPFGLPPPLGAARSGETTAFEPEVGKVTYDYLVISMGVTLRYDLLNGALDALKEDPRVCSNYSPEYMLKTLRAFENFKTGTAVFTFPNPPIKCAGAPLKAMYLFEDYLRRRDRQKDAKILYFTPAKALFSVPKYAKCLSAICDERGIKYSLGHKVIEVSLVSFIFLSP
ncbi:unnamed protein product [Schistocephalus solidus]|uniref:Uncharacterized protein n=1 Tax=Schistocephalus solidus TaxID=70667 RepID=A0A183S7X5_SCHSO|nr:unnamed protein product [Schistocephalus solidus]